MNLRRVVVTGVGLVTPLGVGRDHVWQRLTQGDSGIREVTRMETSDLSCRIGGVIPHVGEDGVTEDTAGAYSPDSVMEPRLAKRVDSFILFGMKAADDAIADSGWVPETDDQRNMTGVMIGSGVGGTEKIEESSYTIREKGPRRVSPFFVTGHIINMTSGYVSIKHGFRGPNHALATACSTGTHAIGDAARLIALGDADVMVAGGSEAPINRVSFAAFTACKALTTNFNDTPEKASRPFDRDRDGFVMGEGAGIVVLEERDHAIARGAKIYGEVIGYGLSGDGYHITAPRTDGDGAIRCMQAAIKRAGISPSDIDYINAHGTSTPVGDDIELGAISRVFAGGTTNLSVSSTKSAVGHLLGAAGAVEAIFSLLAIKNNIVPPTLNFENPSMDTDFEIVGPTKKAKQIDTVLSNSFGFGGTNASLVFQRHAG